MDQNQNDNLFNFDQQPESTPPGAEQPPDATQPPQPLSVEPTISSSGARAYETPGYTPPVPPPPYATPPGTVQQPPKSNRTWLIVLIVVLVLLCCCCLGFVLFMYYVGGDWLIRQMQQSMLPLLQVLA
jgi:hypothetical protein